MQMFPNSLCHLQVPQFAFTLLILLLHHLWRLFRFLYQLVEHEVEVIELVDFVLRCELVDFEDQLLDCRGQSEEVIG